jgi:hypothetical protein
MAAFLVTVISRGTGFSREEASTGDRVVSSTPALSWLKPVPRRTHRFFFLQRYGRIQSNVRYGRYLYVIAEYR